MNVKKAFVIVFILLLSFCTLSAIDRGGSVSGVVETLGTALPGVAVKLTGTAIQGVRSAMTNNDGFFRFSEVPVGNDFQLEFILEGFTRVVEKNVTVSLGKETPLKVDLKVSPMQEEVIVYGRPAVIDTKSSTAQVNLTKETIETLANDRQYQNIMAMMPGAIDANNPFMLGGSGSDNIYNFDGMDNTDPMTKTWSTAMNFDNFEEIQVITAGAPAEYGRGTGAVVNVVTKGGSNSFSGTARFTYSKVDWDGKLLGDRYYFRDATKFTNEARPSVNVGGPILKDKLWFFASYEGRNKWIPSGVYQDYADTLDNVPSDGKAYYKGHYLSGKLTFKLNKNNTITAQYSEDPIKIPDLYSYLGYSSTPTVADHERFQGGWNMNYEWNAILGTNTSLTARYNAKRNELNNAPNTPTGICYYANGVYWGSSRTTYFTNRYYDNLGLNLNQFLNTSFGTHDLKAGVEYLDIRLSRYSQNYPGNEYISYLADGVTTSTRRVYPDRPQEEFSKNSYNRLWSLYIQDKWEVVPNLTLNLGLRAETGKWLKHDKEVMFNWGLGKTLAPRLGLVYNLKGHKFSASWGRFYDIMDDTLVDIFQPNIFGSYYDEYRGQAYGYSDWTYYRQVTFGSAASATIDAASIKPIQMNEFSVNYEHAFSDLIAVGAEFLSRSWKNKWEGFDYDMNLQWNYAMAEFPGDSNWAATLPNWGSTFKRYWALIFNLKKNLGNDKYQFIISYTYSKLRGFVSAEGNDTGFPYDQWGNSYFSDYNSFGYLPLDTRHMFKFNGSVFAPWDIVVGVNFFWQSGYPYGEYIGDNLSSAGTSGARTPSGSYYYLQIEPMDAHRYPELWRLDVRVEKSFKIWKSLKASVFIDVFNLLNNQIEIARDNNIANRVVLNDINDPSAGYAVTSENPNYGNYTQWYPPVSFFLGAKIEF